MEMPSVDSRSLRLAVVLLVAAGVTLLTGQPAAAADYIPTVTVTGAAGCDSFTDGAIVINWHLSQDTAPEGFTYEGIVTFNPSPAVGFDAGGNSLISTLNPRQTIPHGTGATSATLAVSVAYAHLPSGPRVVTSSGSVALPFCPIHVKASVTFAMNCDRSVNVTINYPAGAEASTSATIVGTSLSSAQWNSGPVSLAAGGQTRTVVVPSPYTTEIRVTQADTIPYANAVIGLGTSLQQPASCAFPTPGTGPPGYTPPVATSSQGSGGSGGSGGSSGNVGSGGGANPLVPESSASDPASTPAGGVAPTRSTAAAHNESRPLAADRPDRPMPLLAVAILGLSTGLGAAMLIALGVVGYIALRQRRRARTTEG
jgi:uncharacterized membrane protein YgcG